MEWLTQYADPNLDWNYALITLMVRFIGVFFVMLVMQLALQAVAWGVRIVEAREGTAAGTVAGPAASESRTGAGGIDDATVAVIGLALALERGPTRAARDGRSSPWRMAGRMAQLDRMPTRRR